MVYAVYGGQDEVDAYMRDQIAAGNWPSYSVVPLYETYWREPQGHWETVRTGTVHHEAEGHVERVGEPARGHWEKVRHPEEGHWE